MKTKLSLQTLIRIVLVLLVASVQIACSKDKKSNNNNYGGYYMSNGYCYASNGQITDYSYCQGYNGNNCYQTMQYPPNLNCPPNGGGGMGYGQCVGLYYYQSYYGYQQVYCQGYNCSGQMLYNQYGQPQYCQ